MGIWEISFYNIVHDNDYLSKNITIENLGEHKGDKRTKRFSFTAQWLPCDVFKCVLSNWKYYQGNETRFYFLQNF